MPLNLSYPVNWYDMDTMDDNQPGNEDTDFNLYATAGAQAADFLYTLTVLKTNDIPLHLTDPELGDIEIPDAFPDVAREYATAYLEQNPGSILTSRGHITAGRRKRAAVITETRLHDGEAFIIAVPYVPRTWFSQMHFEAAVPVRFPNSWEPYEVMEACAEFMKFFEQRYRSFN